MLGALLEELVARFRGRARRFETRVDPLVAFVSAALALDETSDTVAARCWVGVLAEAVRDPSLFNRVRRLVDTEVGALERLSRGRLSTQGASALLAFVFGSLVLGAFAPRKTAGFAAPAALALVEALTAKRSG
jgi:hypothetical protein